MTAGAGRRLLFLTPAFHSNLFHALGALTDAGAQVALWTLAPGAPPGAPQVEHSVLDPDALDFAALGRLLRAADPDLVAIRKTGRLSRLLYWAALAQGRRRIAYDQRPWRSPRGLSHLLGGWLRGRPLRRFTPVKGLTGRPDPLAVYLPFPVAADPTALASRTPPPDGAPRILCVGKLAEARKRQPLLIAALAALRERRAFTLTLAGASSTAIGNPDPAQLAALRRHTVDGPLAGRLRVLEDVPFDRMAALYAAHDLCVLPSASEPLGTAPLEAMAHGCAALVSDSAGSAAYVADGLAAGWDCGALFRTDDPAALTAALDALLADPAALAARGAAAAAWTRAAFAPADFARRFLAL